MKIYIGTSGWSYNHWFGKFYPSDINKSDMLRFYSKHFNSVEINSTFYRYPFDNMLKGWYNKTPENFAFSVKAHRNITHKNRLKDIDEDLDRFFSKIKFLKEKAYVILWQLPPSLKKDSQLLIEFVKKLPENYKHAIEFRHKSWFEEEIYEILKSKNIAMCYIDSKRWKSPFVQTSDFIYIRLHGPDRLYASKYSEEFLNELAEKIKKYHSETFVYFNNDFEGYAIENSIYLRDKFT